MIPRFENGHAVVTGLTYDSGDYPGGLKKLLDHVKYAQLRKEQAEARKKGRLRRHRPRVVRRDLRPRTVAGGRRHRLPGRTVGKRDRARSSDRQGARVHRRLAARPGRRDDVRADRRERDRRRCRRREGVPRRHRRHADGLGHLRQPDDRRRRRGAGSRDAQGEGEGQGDGRAPARSRRRGHGLRGRQVLREGIARTRRRRSRTSR